MENKKVNAKIDTENSTIEFAANFEIMPYYDELILGIDGIDDVVFLRKYTLKVIVSSMFDIEKVKENALKVLKK